MKKFVEEFKAFINRGNVVDMAVGVVVGGAFGKITGSLVNDIVMPVISWIFGTRDMTALNLLVRPEVLDAEGNVAQAAITIGFGTFVATILDFLLIALSVFLVLKALTAAKEKAAKKQEAPAEEAPAEPEPTAEEKLLTEIRDLLKNK